MTKQNDFLGCMLSLHLYRRHVRHQVDGLEDQGPGARGHLGMVGRLLQGHPKLVEDRAGVGVPPRRVPQAQESVVDEGHDQPRPPREHVDGGQRHHEDLREGHHPEHVSRLQLDQGDQESGAPPGRRRAQGVQQRQ